MPARVETLPADFEDDRALFELANFYPRTTGLPVTVLGEPERRGRHDVRIKVSSRPGDRIDMEDAAIVAVRPEPALLKGQLSPAYLAAVLGWVRLNAAALIDNWDGAIDTAELIARLQRI